MARDKQVEEMIADPEAYFAKARAAAQKEAKRFVASRLKGSTTLIRTEGQLLKATIDLAMGCGWRVNHALPSVTGRGRWLTAVQGHAGLPDLILARDAEIWGWELKDAYGKPTPDQELWIAAFGSRGRLLRPKDWPWIQATLTAKRVAS